MLGSNNMGESQNEGVLIKATSEGVSITVDGKKHTFTDGEHKNLEIHTDSSHIKIGSMFIKNN